MWHRKWRGIAQKQDHGLDCILDNTLVELCKPAIEKREKVQLDLPIKNVNRTTGTVLSSKIAKNMGWKDCRRTPSRLSSRDRPGNRSGPFFPGV